MIWMLQTRIPRKSNRRCKGKYGSIDILASNAGLNRPMPLDQVTPEVWDSVMNVNLRGAFFMAQAVAPVMKEQGKGRIIFTVARQKD